jgi:lipopolysaccharide biosynthesis glycosyltransferase
MNLIYSCIFFNEEYIELLDLLLKSFAIFGNCDENTKYLIICDPKFETKIYQIFLSLKIKGFVWSIKLSTMFEACYSRLKIFEYSDINKYDKILYLDCDILITNNLSNIFDLNIEEKLYVLNEGYTNGPHDYWGSDFWKANQNPKTSAFTTCVLLFSNNITIKSLFSRILSHIYTHLENNSKIPGCCDQPFIVYNTIKDNLYDNKKLMNYVVNSPWYNSFTGQTISHFPSKVGAFHSKINIMRMYLNYMFHVTYNENINMNHICNSDFCFFDPNCTNNKMLLNFSLNNTIKSVENSYWKATDSSLIMIELNKCELLIKFNTDFSYFIALRNIDFSIFYGIKM